MPSLVHGMLLLLLSGWLLHTGRSVLVPVAFGMVVVYVIVGLAQALERLPVLGRVLPVQLRYVLSIALIIYVVTALAYLVMSSRDSVIALAPQYQKSLLTIIQKGAVFLRIEGEPTWTTLRTDLFSQINLQRLLGSMVVSVSSIVASVFIVLLYATFLLLEQRTFTEKLSKLSTDPRGVQRILDVTGDINRRVGSYLALKTMISILLGVVCWAIMAFFGLEFAPFWAALITLLNFVPYIGSLLAVLFPVVMSVVQFENLGTVLWLLMSLTLAQFVIGNFIDPYLMGNSLNLSPFAILVSLAIWTELWGIPGAFLAVPLTAVIAIVLSSFRETRPIAVMLSRDGRL
ncbi:MAG TPA: AI-2E family transporter [Burkholderiaceae bacterium]|nr:AI-2E family transporter [Burkholderiaceae bacterium]